MIDVLAPETATIVQWLKNEGDPVAEGDVLVEIETDKTVFEVEAPASGTLSQILAMAGDAGVEAGTKIAVIDDGASISPTAGAIAREAAAPSVQQQVPADPAHGTGSTLQSQPAVGMHPDRSASAGASSPSTELGSRIAVSPFARKLAREAGVNINDIEGTGPGGRIVGRDIRAYLKSLPIETSPPIEQSAAQSVPVDGMRRTIAQRLSESKSTVPHFYLSSDMNLDAMLKLRKKMNRDAEQLAKEMDVALPKLSVNDFFIKAVSAALHHRPNSNAIWADDSILHFTSVDVGMAVAVEGGLITPVLRNVHQKSLGAIAADTRDLATRARSRRLDKTEYTGGATTVSNLGMYGVEQFSAIINPPQSSIFAIGAARRKVVVRKGSPKVAWVATVTLSCDHRVIDGAEGAQLLNMVRKFIETPRLLFG